MTVHQHGHKRAGARDDLVMPFEAEGLDVRGRIVRLGPAADAILSRHAYPPPVSRLLGEAIALAVLLGASLKFEGRFILQTQSDGPVSLMVVDFDTPDSIRAWASFDADRVLVAEQTGAGPADLLGAGHLAMTIDQGQDTSRYQGIVPLEGASLADAADLYFRQSEQIPTLVRLAVAESVTPAANGETPGRAWRAGGILIQHLPKGERRPPRDLPPGDAPEGLAAAPETEPDAWTEARALTETVEAHELTDPTLEPERLLLRLFHERGVRVFRARTLRESCGCSRRRIVEMLRRFSAEERADMVEEESGEIVVTCRFCSTVYPVRPEEI
ncbi:MAG: Hsp33 family molecular chaperone [Hyphomicrobiales bacterium]|nr:Hsp33 family molecular chaperone [Hyphomicrobiales bacterium]